MNEYSISTFTLTSWISGEVSALAYKNEISASEIIGFDSALSTHLSTHLSSCRLSSFDNNEISNYLLCSELCNLLSNKIALSTEQNLNTWLSNKELYSVWIRDEVSAGPLSGVYSPLSVIKLHANDYAISALNSDLCSNQLFVIDDDYIDAFGQVISCVVMNYDSLQEDICYRGIAATDTWVKKNFLSAEAFNLSSAKWDSTAASVETSAEYWNSAYNMVSAFPEDTIALSSSAQVSSFVRKNSSKTFIDDTMVGGSLSGYQDLSVVKLPISAYELSVVNGTLSNGVLYVVESDYVEMYDQQISNLVMSEDEPEKSLYRGIAATKPYVDAKIGEIKNNLKNFFTSISVTIREKPLFETVSSDLLSAISSLCETL